LLQKGKESLVLSRLWGIFVLGGRLGRVLLQARMGRLGWVLLQARMAGVSVLVVIL